MHFVKTAKLQTGHASSVYVESVTRCNKSIDVIVNRHHRHHSKVCDPPTMTSYGALLLLLARGVTALRCVESRL